ncbi:hypothetical protein GcM3_203034, partial [Golovinomyces cichoracearum]
MRHIIFGLTLRYGKAPESHYRNWTAGFSQSDTILSTISKALDQAIRSFKDTAQEHLAQQVAERIADTIQSFADNQPSSKPHKSQKAGLEKSLHAPSYAAIAKTLPTAGQTTRLVGPQR